VNETNKPPVVRFLQTWLEHKMRYHDIPALAITIEDPGNRVQQTLTFGIPDRSFAEPLNANHVFGIGSQSKMLTAVAVAQLAERKQLDLDDPIGHFIPSLTGHPDRRAPRITLRQLLQHTGGFARDGNTGDHWLNGGFPNTQELIDLTLQSNVVFDAGMKFKYSNLGYALLGQVVAQVSEQSYESWVRREILDPLSMHSTTTASEQATVSYGRRTDSGDRKPAPSSDTSAFTAAAGWFSTTQDMNRFLQAQLQDHLPLTVESRSRLHRSGRNHWRPRHVRGSSYGLGFMNESISGRYVFGHSGGLFGYRSASFIDPTTRVSVSVASNAMDVPVAAMVKGIFGSMSFFDGYVTAEPHRSAFDAHIQCAWEDILIVGNRHKIVSINPDLSDPFRNINETLEAVGDDRLVIRCIDDMHYDGEHIVYTFDEAGNVLSVDYGGITMKPMPNYTQEATTINSTV
jgi:D-alanyl-D-alanine carboxypeptidase